MTGLTVKKGLLLVTVMTLMVLLTVAAGSRGGQVHPLIQVFSASGAIPEQTDVQVWCKVSGEHLTMDELMDTVHGVAGRLGVSRQKMQAEGVEDEGFTQYQLKGKKGQADLLLMGQSVAYRNQPGGETYVVLRVTLPGLARDLTEREKWLKQGLKGEKNKPEVYLNVLGRFEPAISAKEAATRVKTMLEIVQAKQVDRYEMKNLVAVSAYTPSLKEQIVLGEHIMNLNLVLRSENNEGVTRFWVGSPLITDDY